MNTLSATAKPLLRRSKRFVAAALNWERQDYQETAEGIRQGYEDLKAGRTQPADEVLEELRLKYGLPR